MSNVINIKQGLIKKIAEMIKNTKDGEEELINWIN